MHRVLAAACSVVLAVPLMAQESVTITIRSYPGPNQRATTSDRSEDEGSITMTGPDGKSIEIKPGGAETLRHDFVLEADKDGKPTKYLRTYEKATDTKDGKTTTYSYQGLMLLYEKKGDGKFRIGVVGKGEVSAKDVKRLYDKENKPSESEAILKQLRSRGAVKIGETLTLDVKPVAEAMEAGVDEKQSSITMKLLRVVTRGKTRFGVFQFDQRLLIKEYKDELEGRFDPPAEYTMRGTLELAIDGTSAEHSATMSAKLAGTGTWSQSGTTGKITFDVSGKIRTRTSVIPAHAPDLGDEKITWLPAPGDWVTFRPKSAAFRVSFPTQPKESAKKDARGNNTIQWTASADGGAAVFIIATTDFAGAAGKVDPKLILEEVAKSQKDPMNLKEIHQDGHPGIEFQREEKNKDITLVIHHRVVMAGDRMYQQIVVVEKKSAKRADIEKFMKSFEIRSPRRKD